MGPGSSGRSEVSWGLGRSKGWGLWRPRGGGTVTSLRKGLESCSVMGIEEQS